MAELSYKKAKRVEQQKPLAGMCFGCFRNQGDTCSVIIDPGFIAASRGGECWAWVTKRQARRIEKDIELRSGHGKRFLEV